MRKDDSGDFRLPVGYKGAGQICPIRCAESAVHPGSASPEQIRGFWRGKRGAGQAIAEFESSSSSDLDVEGFSESTR